MAISPNDYYGELSDAVTYFEDALHETDFLGASDADKEKALLAATRAIDALKFRGHKSTVYDAYQAADALGRDPTAEEIATADALQALQFPRDDQADVPAAIQYAAWEEAHSLLAGRDPALERENLPLSSYGSGSTRVSVDTSRPSPEHIAHGITSFRAWRYLLPYLDNNNNFDVSRVR